MGETGALDIPSRTVGYRLIGDDRDRSIRFDHLVVALGSVTRILPEHIVSGVREHAFEMKHMTDAVAVRDRAIELLELANAVEDPEEPPSAAALRDRRRQRHRHRGHRRTGELRSRCHRAVSPSSSRGLFIHRDRRQLLASSGFCPSRSMNGRHANSRSGASLCARA